MAVRIRLVSENYEVPTCCKFRQVRAQLTLQVHTRTLEYFCIHGKKAVSLSLSRYPSLWQGGTGQGPARAGGFAKISSGR